MATGTTGTAARGPVGGYPRIPTAAGAGRVAPSLVDDDAACRTFGWASARALLDGLPDGGINIAHEAVDRHATGARSGCEILR